MKKSELTDLDTFLVNKIAIRPEAFLRALGILHSESKEITDIQLLPKELRARFTRKPDVLILWTEGSVRRLIHLEFQSRNDKRMYLRMREYDLLLEKKYPDYQIEQYVIYLGKSEPTMATQKADKRRIFWYRLIDFRKIRPEVLLESRLPYLIILSVLTGRRTDEQIIEITEAACQKLDELEAAGILDDNEKIAYLYDLQMMIAFRNPKLTLLIQAERRMKLDPTVLPSYIKGKSEGILEGKLEGIFEMCLRLWKQGLDREWIRVNSGLNDKEWEMFLKQINENSL